MILIYFSLVVSIYFKVATYFHDTLDNIPHEVMITDGYKAYPEIIKKFGMKHQRCVFHIMQNVGKDIFPEIRKLKRENKSKENKIDKKKKQLEKNKEEYDTVQYEEVY